MSLPSFQISTYATEAAGYNMQLATDLYRDATAIKVARKWAATRPRCRSVIRDAFGEQIKRLTGLPLSGLIPSIGRYAVIGCKLQVPA